MLKKIAVAVGCLLLAMGLWFLYDHFHYSPPNENETAIKAAAMEALRQQADLLLNSESGWKQPGMKKEATSLQILKVGKVRGKTYVVFKMNFHTNMSPEMMAQMGGQIDSNLECYLLGLRLVEKHLTGLKFKPGMEFESSYLNTGPADCGRHPDGIFYAYFKDPDVKTMVLETDQGRRYTAAVKNRVVILPVPPGRDELYPRFYDADGEEIMPSYNLRLAFVSGDQRSYQPYSSIAAEWWPVKALDILNYDADNVDALWVFPDQMKDLRQPQTVKKIRELLNDGVQVIFVGWKDPGDIARMLGTSQLESANKIDSIEGVYATADNGVIKVGAVGLEDEGFSPLLNKTLRLRYKLKDEAVKESSENKARPKSGAGQAKGSAAVGTALTQAVPVQKTTAVQGVSP